MHIIRNNTLEDVEDTTPWDFHLEHPAQQYAASLNQIPLQSAVQTPRLFYGNRFEPQSVAHVYGEAPLVQNLDTFGGKNQSFDEINGEGAHIIRAQDDGDVEDITERFISLKTAAGRKKIPLYFHMPSNQKSGVHSRPVVKVGDKVTKGKLLAASNFTDDNGVLNMGVNVRTALVPFKGHSMDDAMVASESLAKRMTSEHYDTVVQESGNGRKHDLKHYVSTFQTAWPQEVLKNFDDNGVIKKGTIVQPGQPLILATTPRAVSSAGANVGRLTRALREERRDDSVLWDARDAAEVVDARITKNGVKVILKYTAPLRPGDKTVFRPGAKGTIAKILPDDQMPRTEDGQPLELLLNPLSLYSRANPSTSHELRLGNIARKLGQPMKVPSYLPKGQDWPGFIEQLEKEHGIQPTQRIYDPEAKRFLDSPVSVGYAYLKKLHHISANKVATRGTGAYDADEQPLKGGSDAAQAKRYSGLETVATLATGSYAVVRENATIKGQKNDAFHRALRSGQPLPKAGEPFVWHKFRSLLSGAGIRTRDLGGGRIRLAPMTDSHLASLEPVDVENGGLVDLQTMEAKPGGLFDSRISTHDKWGRIRLPRPVINPAYEDTARTLLGLTKPQMEEILRGRMTIDGKKIDREDPNP